MFNYYSKENLRALLFSIFVLFLSASAIAANGKLQAKKDCDVESSTDSTVSECIPTNQGAVQLVPDPDSDAVTANNTVLPNLCAGQTLPGSTQWQDYNPNGIYLDVDTSGCNFSAVPLYLTSIGGVLRHWASKGATSIYQPTATGFRVFVHYEGITADFANQQEWHLNWAAIP